MGKIADVSHHQGVIDWAKAATELDLVIIRVQFGSKVIDRQYKNYIAGCKAHKIPFGHYAFGVYVSKADAEQEAKDFLARADKEAKFLVLDVEKETIASNKGDLIANTQAFIDYLKKNDPLKRPVGFYGSHHLYDSHRLYNVVADFIWTPRYGEILPKYKCDLWQYTETGKLAGVKGPVDLNRLTGSKPLSYFTGKGYTAAATKPDAKPDVNTLVGYLKSINIDSSGENRDKLAKKYNIVNYTRTAEQNIALLKAIKFDIQAQAEAAKNPPVQKEEPKLSNTPDKIFEEAWKFGIEKKITDGSNPLGNINRQQVMSMIYRAINHINDASNAKDK